MKLKRFNKINENQGPQNYMFFGNLKTMKRLVDTLLEMDENEIDQLLTEHDWASDHISVAAENLEQVFNFFAGMEDEEYTENDNKIEDVVSSVEPDVKSFNDFKGEEPEDDTNTEIK
jgi:hypothetical protein